MQVAPVDAGQHGLHAIGQLNQLLDSAVLQWLTGQLGAQPDVYVLLLELLFDLTQLFDHLRRDFRAVLAEEERAVEDDAVATGLANARGGLDDARTRRADLGPLLGVKVDVVAAMAADRNASCCSGLRAPASSRPGIPVHKGQPIVSQTRRADADCQSVLQVPGGQAGRSDGCRRPDVQLGESIGKPTLTASTNGDLVNGLPVGLSFTHASDREVFFVGGLA